MQYILLLDSSLPLKPSHSFWVTTNVDKLVLQLYPFNLITKTPQGVWGGGKNSTPIQSWHYITLSHQARSQLWKPIILFMHIIFMFIYYVYAVNTIVYCCASLSLVFWPLVMGQFILSWTDEICLHLPNVSTSEYRCHIARLIYVVLTEYPLYCCKVSLPNCG